MRAPSFNAVGCLTVLGSIALSCASYSADTSSDGSGGAGGSVSGSSGLTGSGGGVTGGSGGVTGGSGGVTGGSGGVTGGSGGVTGGSGGLSGGTGGSGGATGSGGVTGGSGGVTGGSGGSGGVTGSGGLSAGSGGVTGGSGGLSGGSGGVTGGSGGVTGGSGGVTGGGSGGLSGGTGGSGGVTGGTGGDITGGTGGATDLVGPCDIYAAGNTPCVGAYSMVRVLSSTYSGFLYQVRRGGPSPNTGSGGETQDIGMLANGLADAAAQDDFCAGQTCTVSIMYDQSGQGNDLTVAPAGCYTGGDGAAAQDDYESSATDMSLTVGGNNVYGLYMNAHEGYRNNQAAGTAEGQESQGVYMVADGTHYGAACCWNFGTASRNSCYGPTGMMAALFFGIGFWGSGEGNGPWFMGDFEAGVWAGGNYPSFDMSGQTPPAEETRNPDNPSMRVPYAFGILETDAGNYALRMGNATSGDLHTAYDGPAPQPWVLEGGIILGIGGDNSNWSYGTFFEGAITAGRPSVDTQDAVYRNVQAAGYGQ